MQILGLADSTPKPTSRTRELFWPRIENDVAAITAARNAMYTSFLVMAGSVFLAIYNSWAWLDVALFLMIGIGIRQLSRVAAVTGLILYLIGWITTMAVILRGGSFGGLVSRVIVTAIFIGGVRAAFFANRVENDELVRELANPAVSSEGRSRVSVALEETPQRVWPYIRIPFGVVLMLLTALNLTVVTIGFLRQL